MGTAVVGFFFLCVCGDGFDFMARDGLYFFNCGGEAKFASLFGFPLILGLLVCGHGFDFLTLKC